MIISSKDKIEITLNNLQVMKENQYFDRKQARISTKEIANQLSAFANANGGFLTIGLADNGDITGFADVGEDKLNQVLQTPHNLCQPTPKYKVDTIDVVNKAGEKDVIVIFDIEASKNKIIKNSGGEVYLRIGDSSKKLSYEDIRNLEYDKGERLYEEEILERSSINDIDTDLLEEYKKILGSKLRDEEILEARGLIVNGKLTKAGMLLFAKNPDKLLEQAKVRFVRYDGIESQTGVSMNIIKDKIFYGPLHKIIDNVKSLIVSQLRDFSSLNPKTGKFQTVPEYPEFAWQEGLVNAVTHRDYSIQGEYIKIIMYDDRLEITSPGKLPNIVNINNLKDKRYSRNPKIARILSEFGWVKELNEGVKRIYEEMSNYFLDEPEFVEIDGSSFRLKLKNNLVMRKIRNTEQLSEILRDDVWDTLSAEEKIIIELVYKKTQVTTKIVSNTLKRSTPTSKSLLNGLCEKGILKWNGLANKDPKQYYDFSI